MNKIITVVIAALLILACSSKKNGNMIVKGNIKGLKKGTLYLQKMNDTAIVSIDSMNVYGNDYKTPDGTGIRDYIHVTDLATAHMKTLNAIIEKKKNIIINLSTGIGYSVLQVLQIMTEITGEEINYNIVERRPGDPAELVAVSKLAHDLISWECEYSDIKTILRSMWKIYSK